jgi:translation initiation factor 2A
MDGHLHRLPVHSHLHASKIQNHHSPRQKEGALPVTLLAVTRHAGASIMWNATGTACLFMATCETDATNQSYYGESKLHYLPAEAARADEACAVAMPKDGPVHDVQWSPAGDYFVVVAGFMPAKVRQQLEHCSGLWTICALGVWPWYCAPWFEE